MNPFKTTKATKKAKKAKKAMRAVIALYTLRDLYDLRDGNSSHDQEDGQEGNSRGRRRFRVRPWRHESLRHNLHYNTLAEVDPEAFRDTFRMSPAAFELLLSKVEAQITKETTYMREAISAKHRLMVN